MAEHKVTRKTRSRGRPTNSENMKNKILNAAERLFAEASYDSVSQRQIASAAEVDQALLNYYFKSKQGLYRAVVQRFGREIVSRWEAGLTKLEDGPEGLTVEGVLRAYLEPFFVYRRQPDLHVLKMQARLHAETAPMFFNIRREIYDEASKKYIGRLVEICPEIDPADVYWRFVFAIGALLFVGPGTDRLDDLSDGAYLIDSPEEAEQRLISFLTIGFTAPSTVIVNRSYKAGGA